MASGNQFGKTALGLRLQQTRTAHDVAKKGSAVFAQVLGNRLRGMRQVQRRVIAIRKRLPHRPVFAREECNGRGTHWAAGGSSWKSEPRPQHATGQAQDV